MIKDQMEKIYRDIPLDRIPWNATTPPEILQRAIRENVPAGGRIIEFGCGAGNYAIWSAKNGYEVTAVDISKNAVEIARRTASNAGVKCRFLEADATRDLPGLYAVFDFAFDWELLHHIFPEDRDRYAGNVERLLKLEGMYLSVCFSEDDPQFGGVGKYRKTRLDTTLYFSSEKELGELFERYFDVRELRTVDIKSKDVVHRAVYALMRKKTR